MTSFAYLSDHDTQFIELVCRIDNISFCLIKSYLNNRLKVCHHCYNQNYPTGCFKWKFIPAGSWVGVISYWANTSRSEPDVNTSVNAWRETEIRRCGYSNWDDVHLKKNGNLNSGSCAFIEHPPAGIFCTHQEHQEYRPAIGRTRGKFPDQTWHFLKLRKTLKYWILGQSDQVHKYLCLKWVKGVEFRRRIIE